MDNRFIMFQSITHAVKAKNFLERAGIRGYVQKTPKINNKTTCGYSVVVKENFERALELLKENRFSVLGVSGDGL